jgi:uncharacterized protein (TIGR02646 family)
MQDLLTFGAPLPGVNYISRPGAYALFFNAQSELGLVRTDGGRYFADSKGRNHSAKAKSGPAVGKRTFDAIKQTLKGMCVSTEICNYCEQNEANDIEHVYPKSLFPEMAFQWNNFLLACKQCNTAYKLDSFAVLDADDDIMPIPRGTEPPHSNGAFIHPRMENPADFMILNLGSFKFEFMPGLDKKAVNKTRNTLDVLQLNARDQLVESRKAQQYNGPHQPPSTVISAAVE